MSPDEIMEFVRELTISQLAELKQGIEKEQQRRKTDAAREIRERVSQLAKELDVSTDELMQKIVSKSVTGRSRAKIPPKYRDPDNPSNEWTGRGQKPVWLREKLEQGRSLEDFLIDKKT